MMRRSALLLSVLALAACDTDPGLSFSYEDRFVDPPPATFPRDSVVDAGSGLLRITRNNVVAPCFNDVLEGRGTRVDREVTLRVTRRGENPCTNETDRVHRYTAFFSNLSAGAYRVRVYENLTGTEQLVKDTTLSID